MKKVGHALACRPAGRPAMPPRRCFFDSVGMGLRPAKVHEKWWGRRFRLPTLDSSPRLAGGSACPTSAPSVPAFSILLGWAFGPRKFMKNGGAGAFACQLLIRVRGWQAEAPAPPGFSTLSQGLPHGIRSPFVVSPKWLL